MAMPGLTFRKTLAGTGLVVSLLLNTNGIAEKTVYCFL